ncbi:methylenetetrahydrofolate reductase C-terminal domain-containing protein [Acinetobacter sp. VNH17]|uniref:Methylenetetrahydrofolate reductase n=1 Tax=Acinetobacter thutiue TaxID=2998078 RepID=A0ABT7WJP1_9GAMM|nr:methylenetetrahydrofolate reductase C-terminal domain-containing protein [Acinetobacter thutiue]MCY6410776.1 methylenetetrahydrofolate reductase C-terminal domain-containing protein [Acinetobacter thutiue]MDN0012878.1 methylenetetrahydrofolate reductase C-terminal domain-containing protein [Acinetobacter thutiue]
MPLFSQCLDQKQFCILVEYICSTGNTLAVTQSIAGFPAMMTLADRVHSDEDPEPIDVAKHYPQSIEKLIHFSGKGRDINEFEEFLDQAEQLGERNLLLLTGDKLKKHQFGKENTNERTRYLESVNAVMTAKKRNGFNIGVAFNPFKYTEAERDAQYLKLHKKIKAGADFLITQLGFDLDKIKQTKKCLIEDYPHFPLIACVMPLTLRRAKFMLRHQVAGIVIPKHLLHVLEQEYQADPIQAEKNVYARCALQILICQHLGYVGVHLSACHKQDEQQQLEQALQHYQGLSLKECEMEWNALWQAETEKVFQPEVKIFAKKVSTKQLLKYKTMHWMHNILFDSRPAMGVGRFVFKASFWNKPKASHLLLKVEHLSKRSIVGCESCGQCRLSETLYICPETCPKGLANGPCGGTSLDRCEFGDRECIHSIKARLAKAVQQTELLKTELIPTVAITTRQSSSWKNWYLATEA